MNSKSSSRGTRTIVAAGMAAMFVLTGQDAVAAVGGGGGGGDGEPDAGSLYSDLVVAYRAADGTPILKEYLADTDDDGEADTPEYCVQPMSYEAVPGVAPTVNPLDGRDVWVLPLQGEWLGEAEVPVEEIEACDPQPQYAMFVAETELERLNLTRTSEEVLAKKAEDVKTKLRLADTISLDPAGRIATDGAALDAAPEYASMYESLMTTGTIPGLPESMAGPPATIPAGEAGAFDAYELGAVAIGTAAGKYVPITVDTVEYYNRVVGFTTQDPLPLWDGMLPFISSSDPDPTTPMATDALPGGEQFVDYSEFRYNRSETFIGSVTWLDVPELQWRVSPILEAVDFVDITKEPVADRTLTGVTAFTQMADDVRSVIVYLHENEVVLPGFYMDPVGVDTTTDQLDAITEPAVDVSALPEQIFQTLPFQVTTSLFNPWGGEPIDEGRVRITLDAPDALTATDVTVTYDGAPVPFTANGDGDLVGWWGPDAGSVIDKGYHESATFDVIVGDGAPTGTYNLGLELVDVDDATTILAQDVATMEVHANALTVLWSAEISPLATQESFIGLPVRVYAPAATEDGDPAQLTFGLTGPEDDPATPLVEELASGDAKVYGSDGTDMVAMPLSLNEAGQLVGTWNSALTAGFNDLQWYLNVADTAPVGQYAIDVGMPEGTDLAQPTYVSMSAPAQHGQKPPGAGEDTTDPIVSLSVDGIVGGTASFTIAVNEPVSQLQCQLTANEVKGTWEDCTVGGMSYQDLAPGDHTLAVKATDLAGNSATYAVFFTIEDAPETISPTLVLRNGSQGNDIAKVNAPAAASGATVKLFKVRKDGSVVRPALATQTASATGNARLVVVDSAKQRFTTYQARVGRTEDTLPAWTPQRNIR